VIPRARVGDWQSRNMRLQLGLVLLLVACSSDKAHIGDGKDDLDSGTGGLGGLGGTSGASTGGVSGGGTGGGGTGGTGTGGDASTGPPLWVDSTPLCSPKYAGSFECYCELGEMYHPVGCDTTRDELYAKNDEVTLVEYDCGMSVVYVPASLDGDQEYIFDSTGKLVGAHVSSDHGPACSAGDDVGESCVVADCTQKTVDSPPCPL
jgi:hypothetical protein